MISTSNRLYNTSTSHTKNPTLRGGFLFIFAFSVPPLLFFLFLPPIPTPLYHTCLFLSSLPLLSFVRGGGYGNTNKGKTGYYWPSYPATSNLRVKYIYFSKAFANYDDCKGRGFSLRCVVRQEGGGENKE